MIGWFNKIVLGCSLMIAGNSILSAEEAIKPVMRVRGAGFFKDRLLAQQLETLFQEDRSHFNPADIEDAALILISSLQNDGYLEAKVVGTLSSTRGTVSEVHWDRKLDVFLPGDTEVRMAEFRILPGPRFYYRSLSTNENPITSKSEIESFYYSEPYFFSGDRSKIFTTPVFASGTQNLQSHLRFLGYQDAEVFSEVLNQDTATGATDVKITLHEGPLYKLEQVNVSAPPGGPQIGDFSDQYGNPYNTFLRQDIVQKIRNRYYASGYAKVSFEHSIVASPRESDLVEVVLNISVIPGVQYTLSEIKFEGAENIRRSLLEKQLTLKAGDFLDPTNLDDSRLNLSRLGLFQKVELEMKEVGENKQALTFKLSDRTTWELNSLLGWGSYENLRLGLQAEKLNALGRGHRLQFKSVISTKSLLGETRYLVPDFLGLEIPFSTKLFYLQRDELSFERQELGIIFGTSKYLEFLDMTMNGVYNFESLDARINSRGGTSTGPDNVRSGSIAVRFTRDKRDNPLNPQSGYRFFGNFEWGSEALGGEVDYQSAELGLSYHDEIKRGLIWHGSLSHAVVGSFYQSQSQVPTNKLLYPGGDNSIRGYERGGASPRDATGDFVGAKSYLLLNLELEQRLTDTISVVGFFDGMGMTANIDKYPFDDYLTTIGLGVRFRTFMGPIRLEYGHNLDQRPMDPSGTYHLTIGYPF